VLLLLLLLLWLVHTLLVCSGGLCNFFGTSKYWLLRYCQILRVTDHLPVKTGA